ncbi:MAG: pyridoxal phosphate-dependent aminotransferase [Thermodesulfobacteriota bacterium]
MSHYLARRNRGVEWSGIRIMFALADQIPGVINLGIGQPDFDTPEFIREAAKKALDDGFTRYPPARGFPDLREAVSEKLQRENNIQADPDTDIFIAVGAMQVIFNACLHLLDPDDEVIILDPGYDYYSQIRLFGGVPVPVPAYEENHFKVDPADIQAAVTVRTKLIIVNTPANPTGAVLEEGLLREIADLAIKNNLLVLSDEPYEHIIFDGKRHVSLASFDGLKERTISAFTLSKSYAMTGWRVGYAVAPKPIVDEMEKLMEHMVSGVSAVAQRAALAALTGPRDCIRRMLAEYDRRRALVYEGLNNIEGLSCLNPEATFYAFPNIKRLGLSSWDLAKYLVREHRVALVPGSIFGRNGEGYLRLSFAAGTERLEEGLRRLKEGTTRLLEQI